MFSIEAYLTYLDSVIVECRPVPCLTKASNAVTRRATATYYLEREQLRLKAAQLKVSEFSEEDYDSAWSDICKNKKYGVLRHDYAEPKTSAHDLRYPQDGRCVPGYAKDSLAQLRTLSACVSAASTRDSLAH